jgi:EmrB/QacA subfamily drug resistance transporter
MTLGFAGDDSRQKVLVLLTMCFALFMAMLDNTVVNVALPTISRDLGAGVSGLQWIVDGYSLAFASLLLTGGTIGDSFGRKRVFLAGLGLFTLASLACGLSSSSEMLIGFRIVQGVGAALLMPGTLSIITVTFPPQERARAIGIWAGVSALALALGPTLGGWVVERFGWQSVFFLNVPIGIAGVLIGMRIVRESKSDEARKLDLPGLALGTAGLFSIVYGLIEANQLGWSDPVIMGSLIAGGFLLVAFLTWEWRAPHAMLPLSFFRDRAFSAGNHVAFSVSFGLFAIFFFLSLYMQLIRGYSALSTGVRFLPLTLMIVIVAPQAGRFAQKHGSRIPMTVGMAAAGAAMLLLSRITATTSYAIMAPLFAVIGAGIAATMTPMTAAVMNSVGRQRAGLGSAMTNTSREVGGVFGIALLGTLLTTRLSGLFRSSLAALGLPGRQAAALDAAASHGQLPAGLLRHLPPQQVGLVVHAYQSAFISGLRLAMVVSALVLLAGAVVSVVYIPGGPPASEDPTHAPAAAKVEVTA